MIKGLRLMKFVLMLIFAGFTSAAYSNSYLWDNESEADSYVGIQLSIPLDKKSQADFLSDVEFEAVLVETAHGYTQGFIWSIENTETHSLGYLRPTPNFSLAGRNIKERTTTFFTTGDKAPSMTKSNMSGGVVELFIYVIAFTYVAFDVISEELEDIFKGEPDTTDETSSRYSIPALKLLADPHPR